MLYDRPVRELMREAARQLPSPTTPNEITGWFAREYPLVQEDDRCGSYQGPHR